MYGVVAPVNSPPRQIDVEYPEFKKSQLPEGTLMVTSLFRENLSLPELLAETQRLRRRAGRLSILSAGCSNGAEADTMLSLQNVSGDSRLITLWGVDFNPAAIRAAKAANYLLPLAIYEGEAYDSTVGVLRGMGFSVDPEPTYKLNEPWGEQGYVEIDATPVRQGHSVDFMEGDLRQGLPKGLKADLVLANNVFYHLDRPGADAALRVLAGAVKKGGLLSIGGVAYRELKNSRVTYPNWLKAAEVWLASEMGLVRANSIGDAEANIFVKL